MSSSHLALMRCIEYTSLHCCHVCTYNLMAPLHSCLNPSVAAIVKQLTDGR